VLLRPHLEYFIHFRLPLQKRCREIREDPVEGYRMVRDILYMLYKESQREFGLFSLTKRRGRGSGIATYNSLKGI